MNHLFTGVIVQSCTLLVMNAASWLIHATHYKCGIMAYPRYSL